MKNKTIQLGFLDEIGFEEVNQSKDFESVRPAVIFFEDI